MRIIRNVLFLAFFMVSSLCSAQMFSVSELITMSEESVDDFRKTAVDRGYLNENVTDNGLSASYDYSTQSGNSVISLVLPSFSTDVRMLTWSFAQASAYQDLKSQLERDGYKLINTEKRNSGKYLSLYYFTPGFDIILTSDKTSNSTGKYSFSIKTTKSTGSLEPVQVIEIIDEPTHTSVW